MARPTKLTDSVLKKARHYVENYEEYGDPVPTIAALAIELDVMRSTCYEWAKTSKAFSDILMRAEVAQERKLVGGGLAGGFNPAVTKMMLTKHGYSDKQEIGGPDGAPLTVQVVKFAESDEEGR